MYLHTVQVLYLNASRLMANSKYSMGGEHAKRFRPKTKLINSTYNLIKVMQCMAFGSSLVRYVFSPGRQHQSF